MAKGKVDGKAAPGKGKIVKHPKAEYSKEWLKVEFTKEELAEMSDEMAGGIVQVGDLEDQLASVSSQIKSQIKTLTLRVKELSEKIRNKSEHRNEKVRMIKDFKLKRVYFYLEDADGYMHPDFVKDRVMHPGELQMNLTDVDQSPDGQDGPVAG